MIVQRGYIGRKTRSERGGSGRLTYRGPFARPLLSCYRPPLFPLPTSWPIKGRSCIVAALRTLELHNSSAPLRLLAALSGSRNCRRVILVGSQHEILRAQGKCNDLPVNGDRR
jgi:hypothetical protein